jgi:hypothetical protein
MEDEIVEEEGFVERAFIPYRPRKRRRNNENEKDYQRTCYEDGREEIVLINRLKSQLETLEAEVLLAKISLLERDYKIKEFETIVSEKEKENQQLKTELKKCRQTIGMFRMWKRKRPKGTGSLQHLPKIEAESICHLFDMGLTFGTYDLLRKTIHGKIKEKIPYCSGILPSRYKICKLRSKIHEELWTFKPQWRPEGIELDPEMVLKKMAEILKWKGKEEVTVAIGLDARLLSKGLKGIKPQTIVGICERGKDSNLSPDYFFRLGYFWGKEHRQLVKRNMKSLIAYLNNTEEPGVAYLDVGDGEKVKINIMFCSDLMAMKQIFPSEGGCCFCKWEAGKDGHTLFKIENPNEVPPNALFRIPRKNIVTCVLHKGIRIVELLVKLLLQQWSALKSSPDKATRKQGFENYLQEQKIFSNDWELTEEKVKIFSLSEKDAIKILQTWEELVRILEPQPRETTINCWRAVVKSLNDMQIESVTSEKVTEIKRDGTDAMTQFRTRFFPGDVTPYLHDLSSHLWESQERCKEISEDLAVKFFSGRQMENANLQDQLFYHHHSLRGSNAWRKPKNAHQNITSSGTVSSDSEINQPFIPHDSDSDDHSNKELEELFEKPNTKELLGKKTCEILKKYLYWLGESQVGVKDELVLRILDRYPKFKRKIQKMNERISMENLKQKTELEQDLRSDINWKLLQFRTRKIYFMINGNDKEVQKIKEKRKKKKERKEETRRNKSPRT